MAAKETAAQSYIPAILVALLLIIFPPLLLIVYQTKVFKKLLTIVRLDSWPPLHMFVGLFQGNYKDGTEGTYDYRFLSGVYLVFRIIIVMRLNYTTPANGYYVYLLIAVLLFISASLFQTLVQPYKKRYMNVLESLIFALCSLFGLLFLCYLYLPALYSDKLVTVVAILVVIAIPMCAFLCYLTYKFIHCVYRRGWFRNTVLNFLRKVTRRRGPGAEDGELERESLDDSFADRLQQPCRYYGSLADNPNIF